MIRTNEIESNFVKNVLSFTYNKDENILCVDAIGNEYNDVICNESKMSIR